MVRDAHNPPQLGEVYFEFTQVGRSMKISAIDAKTGTEVTVVGSTAYDQGYLEHLALRKLQKRLREENNTPPPPKKGRIV